MSEFLEEFLRLKFKTPNLYERFFEISAKKAEIFAFAKGILQSKSDGGTIFDDSLYFLGESEFAELLVLAFENLQHGNDENANELISAASVQFCHLLHPYLEQIWRFRPNWSAYYCYYPWRGLDYANAKIWRDRLQDEQTCDDDKEFLFFALLLSGDEKNVKFAHEQALKQNFIKHERLNLWLEEAFLLSDLKTYAPSKAYHLIFDDDYLPKAPQPWLERYHETWQYDNGKDRYEFGGVLEPDEKNPLFHLITLDPIPSGVNVSLKKLTIGVHIRQVNEGNEIFYRHDEGGYPHKISQADEPTWCLEDEPIKPCQISICATPQRYIRQDWAMSNSRQNLNRLGGVPSWIQGSQVPICPICGEKMQFLMQLDTCLPDISGNELFFGSGGICYVFWCDKSRVSCAFMQCT